MVMKRLRKKKTAKKIWIGIAIFIIFAFVFWGPSSVIRSRRGASYAGKIFGRKVSFQDYNKAYLAVRNQAILLLGDKFTALEKNLNLKGEAWDRLILLREAKRQNIKVADKEVIEAIQKYPIFAKNGRFDAKTYEDILNFGFRTPPRAFEEQMRENLIIKKLYKKITSNLKLSDAQVKQEYKKENEQLSIYYLAAYIEDFLDSVSLNEEEIKDYFDKNPSQFRKPPSFNLEYVEIEIPQNLKENDVKALQDKLKDIYLGIKKEKDFTKFAQDPSIKINETGFFTMDDPIPGIGWSAEILQIISNLKKDEITQPILTQKGYYILKLKEKRPAYIPEFEEVKDRVKDILIKDKASEIARSKINTAKSHPKISNFAKVAKQLNLKTGSTAVFKRKSYIEGLGGSDEFFKAAVKLKDTEISDVIEIPQGFYIVKLKEWIPIDEKKFQEERDGFKQKILQTKKEESFMEFLNNLKKKANLVDNISTQKI